MELRGIETRSLGQAEGVYERAKKAKKNERTKKKRENKGERFPGKGRAKEKWAGVGRSGTVEREEAGGPRTGE